MAWIKKRCTHVSQYIWPFSPSSVYERESLTNALISESLEKLKGIQRWKIAIIGLPAPQGQITSVGFVVGDAIPALEDLLAGVIVARSDRWIVDPCPFRVIAGFLWSPRLTLSWFKAIFVVFEKRRNVFALGASGNGEDENNGSEGEEKEGEEGGRAPKGDVLPFWVVPQRHQRGEFNAINGWDSSIETGMQGGGGRFRSRGFGERKMGRRMKLEETETLMYGFRIL